MFYTIVTENQSTEEGFQWWSTSLGWTVSESMSVFTEEERNRIDDPATLTGLPEGCGGWWVEIPEA